MTIYTFIFLKFRRERGILCVWGGGRRWVLAISLVKLCSSDDLRSIWSSRGYFINLDKVPHQNLTPSSCSRTRSAISRTKHAEGTSYSFRRRFSKFRCSTGLWEHHALSRAQSAPVSWPPTSYPKCSILYNNLPSRPPIDSARVPIVCCLLSTHSDTACPPSARPRPGLLGATRSAPSSTTT